MRTNVVLDDALVKKALEYTGLKTKKDVIDHALRELVKRKAQKEIIRWRGKLRWEGDLEEMRKDRFGDTR